MDRGGAILFAAFVCANFLTCRVAGSVETDDMSIEEFVDYVNPPAVLKYRDDDGDPFLCVKFEDQLSLRPKTKGSKNPDGTTSASRLGYSNVTHCPEKALTLREVTKQDVMRVGGVSAFFKKTPLPDASRSHTDVRPEPSTFHEYAVVEFTSGQTMSGTSAIHSVWKPFIASDGYFSLAEVWVSESSRKESIEAGWHVFPQRYGDDLPRFFVYWTSDRYQNTGCYNLECPGFVVLDDFVLRGKPLMPTKYLDRTQYEVPISIFLAQIGNIPVWQLVVYGRLVGYWPTGLFSSLSHSASLIVYGGEVSYNPDKAGQPLTSTDMGSGHNASEGWRSSANIRQIKFLDSNGTDAANSVVFMAAVVSKPACYDVLVRRDDAFGGLHIFYGGTGGDAANCIVSDD